METHRHDIGTAYFDGAIFKIRLDDGTFGLDATRTAT
jgi:hypothetical protein